MNISVPIINFNGAFLVDSLEVGSLLLFSKRVTAVKISVLQSITFSVVAHGRPAAEIYAYCVEAHLSSKKRLEAHAPSYLVIDQQSGSMLPVIASITWYIKPALRTKCIALVEAVLAGDFLGDEIYPVFQGKPFAHFAAE
jgi:hypothetical protein